MIIPWEYHDNAMRIPWEYHDMTQYQSTFSRDSLKVNTSELQEIREYMFPVFIFIILGIEKFTLKGNHTLN